MNAWRRKLDEHYAPILMVLWVLLFSFGSDVYDLVKSIRDNEEAYRAGPIKIQRLIDNTTVGLFEREDDFGEWQEWRFIKGRR